jgi:hypothetical protein
MLSGVSTSGTSPYQIQLGSGSITTSGYLGQGSYISSSAVSNSVYSSGFVVVNSPGAAFGYSGFATICLFSGNTWCESSSIGTTSGSNAQFFSAGSIGLSGTLSTEYASPQSMALIPLMPEQSTSCMKDKK